MILNQKYIKVIITNIIFIIIGLISLEGYLRYTYQDWTNAQNIGVIRDVTFNYETDFYGSNENILYERGKYGLRDDCNINEVTVLTIGGSTTDQRYLNFEETFQYKLQKKISVDSSRKICVSNAGIDGHSSYGHILSFEYWFPLLKELNVELYILYIGINDAFFIGDEKKPEFISLEVSQNNKFKDRLLIYENYERFRKIFNSQTGEKQYAGHNSINLSDDKYTISEIHPEAEYLSEINAEDFRIRLKTLLKKIKNQNVSVLCVTQPHRFVSQIENIDYGVPDIFQKKDISFSGLDYDLALKKINNVIIEECGSEKVIDLYSHNFVNSHFYDYAHTTPEGSEEIADQIYLQLKEMNLFEQ